MRQAAAAGTGFSRNLQAVCVEMVDAPITCSLLNHSVSFHAPAVRKKQKASITGPEWDDDKAAGFCHSCGFQFNVLIR